MIQKQKVIFLMGPTASGKTQLATQLVKKLPLEIISVDSAMIYKGMDIGTGKPSQSELKNTPHYLIDIREPTQSYSAAQFRDDALAIIKEVHVKQKIPFLVGGTMLYFKALKDGISELPHANHEIREKLRQDRECLGLEKLYERLEKIDPVTARKVHPNDPHRLLRALEVYEITGKPMSSLLGKKVKLTETYDLLDIAMTPHTREALHERITYRFEEMMKQGFVGEVKKLYDRGDLTATLPSMRSVGYRQIWDYLSGNPDFSELEEAKQKAIIATRQFAKRQFTWLRRWENLNWLDSDEPELFSKAYDLIYKFITNL